EYICPKDPEVRSDRPGPCPKCGMALEPRAAAVDGPNPELIDLTRRLIVCIVLTLPLVVFHFKAPHDHGWLQLLLAAPVVLGCGWPFWHRAAVSVRSLSPNMFTLIALGVGTSFGASVAALLWPNVLGEALYFE